MQLRNFTLFLLALLMTATTAVAQQTSKSKASKVKVVREKEGDYRAMILKYEQGELGDPESFSPVLQRQIAESYLATRDYAKALPWYAKLIQADDDPTLMLTYGELLQINGMCTQAVNYFKGYDRAHPEDGRGKAKAAACTEATEYAYSPAQVDFKHLSHPVSTPNFESVPAPTPDGVIYSSSIYIDKESDETRTILLAAKPKADGSFEEIKPYSLLLNRQSDKGGMAVSKDGRRIYITGRDIKRRGQPTTLKIFTARRGRVDFQDVLSLPLNSDQYNTSDPHLSDDEKTLYFASDRPGGLGGFDLYKSEYRDGKWQDPVNLGPEVNTAGDERAPVVDGTTLYFSSNGHAGMGAMDLYQAEIGNDGKAGKAVNMGTPFNSTHDDLSINWLPGGKRGYVVSARPGGAGEDDVYYFEVKE